jgi:predicted RNA-binding protein Jag
MQLDDKKIQITANPIAGKINNETFEDLSTRKIEDIKNIQAEYLRRLLSSMNINYKINLSAENSIIILQI